MSPLTTRSRAPHQAPAAALRLLADPVRLRILRLLEDAELSVGELVRSLDLAQSRVSNHLRLLREAGLLEERRAGTRTYLSPARPAGRDADVATRLWSFLRGELQTEPEFAADALRLERVLAERDVDAAFFDRLAGDWDKLAGAFRTGRARERTVAQLIPRPFVVADLGCGTGFMAEALLGCASKVVCVDASAGMLAEAERRLGRREHGTELEFRLGTLDALPVADGELDAAVMGLVLHHLEETESAFRELARVLKPGGSAAVLELAPHDETWMRQELGDRRLGIPADEILASFERAGFEDLVLEPAADHYRPRRQDSAPGDEPTSLSLNIVRGRRPHTENAKESR